MEFIGDDSGLSELQKQIEDAFFSKLVEIGKDAIRYAQKNGEYQNHTFNLRNAPGFCVVRDGRIVAIEVGDDGGHPEAVRKKKIKNKKKRKKQSLLTVTLPRN